VKTCPKGLIKKSDKTNRLGDFLVEFQDDKKECLGCAMCAKRCPDMAIEVWKG
jgi:2-oxoglutarate ferredoxin oxidoreductase subunit delta